jgi:lincosamide nucleotidyltransferase A/C/D/E
MRLLGDAHVKAYVGGGWGVDALLGEQTRPHRDLDISFDANDELRLVDALDRAGFSLTDDQRPVRPA